jgi:hypothetical protein
VTKEEQNDSTDTCRCTLRTKIALVASCAGFYDARWLYSAGYSHSLEAKETVFFLSRQSFKLLV